MPSMGRWGRAPFTENEAHRIEALNALQLLDTKKEDKTSPGTLCLIDTRPRDLDEMKIDLLRELGRLVEREMAATLPT